MIKNLISGLLGDGDSKRSAAAKKGAAKRAAEKRKRSAAAKKAAATRGRKAKARSSAAKKGARTRSQRRARVDAMLDAVRRD